jgi:hypothetical protein
LLKWGPLRARVKSAKVDLPLTSTAPPVVGRSKETGAGSPRGLTYFIFKEKRVLSLSGLSSQVPALISQDPLDKIVPPQDTQADRCVRWLGRAPHTTFRHTLEFRVHTPT